MFSKPCPTGPNTFLSDEKKLGRSHYSYHNFRLNWIILLAFHSYCNKQSTLVTVGRLITALYNAFLGWLATLSYKDTFTQLFSNTLQDPITTYSGIVRRQLNASLNSENSSYNDVYTLVQKINNKMCELQDVSQDVIDMKHEGEYDDPENDPDYVPPEGNESDDSNGDTSPRRRAAAVELRGLSPADVPSGESRRRRFIPALQLSVPPGGLNPEHVIDSNSDVEMGADQPPNPVLELPIGDQVQDGSQSARIPYERSRIALNDLIQKGRMPIRASRPTSSPPPSQPGSVSPSRESLRVGALSTLHPVANNEVKARPDRLPRAVQQQTSQQLTSQQLASQSKQLFSMRPEAATKSSTKQPPHPTPAPILAPVPVWKATPPAKDTKPGFSRSDSANRRLNPGNKGGSNKKRTRKHKKHTSISAFRRPTRRRRRIPPTEGHKYTRKHPRT
jgi:hypothetical protein